MNNFLRELRCAVDDDDDCFEADREKMELVSSAPYSYHNLNRAMPIAVVSPRHERHVQQIMRVCSRAGINVIPMGAGTSLEGQTTCEACNSHSGGGIEVHSESPFVCISFALMRRIVAIHADDLDVVVEPGVSFPTLDAKLKEVYIDFVLCMV